MIQNHPYITAIAAFFIALALGLYLQLQPQIGPESDPLSDNNDGSPSSNERNNHRWYHVRHDASEKHPSPRLAHASATVKHHNNNNTEMMYIFGGLYGGTSKDTSPPRILSDLWRYDELHYSWHAIQQGSGSRAPSGRIHSTLSATEDGKHLVLFGGFDGFVSDPNHKAIDDGVWIFDIAEGSWRNYNIKDEEDPSASRPSARGSHETVIIGDNLFLFGGTAKIGTSFANSAEFWRFSLKTYKWKLLASSLSASSLSTFPRGRQGFPMVKIGGTDDCTHQIYLFGGNCEPPTIQQHKNNDNSHNNKNNNKPVEVDVRAEKDKPLPPLLPTECNDEWIIDVSSVIDDPGDADQQPSSLPRFTQLQTTGDIPSPRRATHVAAVTTDATHPHHHLEGHLFLFGGLSIALKKQQQQQQQGTPTAPIPVPTLFDDFYMLDLKTKIWKKIFHNSETRPPPLFGHTCVQVRDKIVLFGGRASSMASPGTNDVWEYRLMN